MHDCRLKWYLNVRHSKCYIQSIIRASSKYEFQLSIMLCGLDTTVPSSVPTIGQTEENANTCSLSHSKFQHDLRKVWHGTHFLRTSFLENFMVKTKSQISDTLWT